MTLTDKLERAILKGTGCQLSADEVQAIFYWDIADVAWSVRLKVLKEMQQKFLGTQSLETNSSP